MLPHLFRRAGLAAFAVGALLTLSPTPSHAEQFVLFDVTFTMTWEDATTSSPSKSHHYVKSDSGLSVTRPTNWVSPVNYRNGKVHIYLEVLEKPAGGQSQGWALCYVGGGSYGCPYTEYYTATGVYERDVDMHSFYNNATIDFTKGISQVDMIYTINDSGSGHVHNFPELKDKTTPTKVRIAMVQVSEGDTYDPSILPGTGSMAGSGGAGGTPASGGAAGAGGMNVAGSPSGGVAGGGGVPAQGGVSGTATTPSVSGASSGGGTSGGAPSSAGTSSITSATGATSEASGCGLGAAPVSSAAPWLVLGLFGLVRRRRARA